MIVSLIWIGVKRTRKFCANQILKKEAKKLDYQKRKLKKLYVHISLLCFFLQIMSEVVLKQLIISLGRPITIRNCKKKVTQTVDKITPDIQPVRRPVNNVIPDVQVDKTIVHVNPEDQSTKKCLFEDAVKEFESKCEALSNFCCQSCQKTGISIKRSRYNNQICTMCQASHTNKEQLEKDLPIWYDKAGAVQ